MAKSSKISFALLLLLFFILLYSVSAYISDFDKVSTLINQFSFNSFVLTLILVILTQLSRAVRWFYYLKVLNINVNFRDSVIIFLASLSLGFTPGKIGEGIKAYLLYKKLGVPISDTISLILPERITDIVSLLIILLLSGATLVNSISILFIALFLVILIFLLRNTIVFDKILNQLKSISFIKKNIDKIKLSYANMNKVLTVKVFIISLLISIGAWCFEFLAFYLIVIDYSNTFNFIQAVNIYSYSTLLGSLAVVPAGLGVTDFSLGYSLSNILLSKELAVVITFLIRTFFLWFPILLGIPFYLVLRTQNLGTINK